LAHPPETKNQAIVATYTSIVPGLGHLLLGKRVSGLLLFVLVGGSAALTAAQLQSGLAIFDGGLGGFLFGALMRLGIMFWGLSFLDAYLTATKQGDPVRRRAVAANLLLPGLGYLISKNWLRGLASLVVVGWLVWTARSPGRFYDLIFLGLQAITAFEVYQRLALAEIARDQQGGAGQAAYRAPSEQVAAGQVVLPFILMGVAIGVGWITIERVSAGRPLSLTQKDVIVDPEPGRKKIDVKKLGLTFFIAGEGWKVRERGAGLVLRASHPLGASLLVGAFPIRPFAPRSRQLEQFAHRAAADRYRITTSRSATVKGFRGHKLVAVRKRPTLTTSRHVTVFAPRGNIALVFVLSGQQATCDKLLTSLQKTLASIDVDQAR
jgi:hypothetical protein